MNIALIGYGKMGRMIEQICKETCYEEWQEHAAEIVDGIEDGKDEQSHE